MPPPCVCANPSAADRRGGGTGYSGTCRTRGQVPGDSLAVQVLGTTELDRSLMQSNQRLPWHSFRASAVSVTLVSYCTMPYATLERHLHAATQLGMSIRPHANNNNAAAAAPARPCTQPCSPPKLSPIQLSPAQPSSAFLCLSRLGLRCPYPQRQKPPRLPANGRRSSGPAQPGGPPTKI